MGNAWGQAQPPSRKGHPDHSKSIIKQLHGSGSQHSHSPSPLVLDPGKLSWTGSRGDGSAGGGLTSTHHSQAGDAVPSGAGQEPRVQGHCHLMFQAPKLLRDASACELARKIMGKPGRWREKAPLSPESATHCSVGTLSA